jgi:hypothetical protein
MQEEKVEYSEVMMLVKAGQGFKLIIDTGGVQVILQK